MDKLESTKADPASVLISAMDFTTTVQPNGYVWWYVDAISDDGDQGLTIIAFIGSVFSPYYAAARRKGEADPENHIALNVALYDISGSGGGKRWAMTERGRDALARTGRRLEIGPSRITIDGDGLVIRIDETTVPWPSRLRGEVRVTSTATTGAHFFLDDAGRHRWSPLSPRCRVEVDMAAPGRRWSGQGYLDRNQGERPLEDDFSYWDWSRASLGQKTAILYDVVRRDGSERSLGLLVDPTGAVTDMTLPPRHALRANRWRVPRRTQADVAPGVLQTLEDTPFYSRSHIRTQLLGKPVTAMHESLSLDRFARRWVQRLLPFRMPRRR